MLAFGLPGPIELLIIGALLGVPVVVVVGIVFATTRRRQ